MLNTGALTGLVGMLNTGVLTGLVGMLDMGVRTGLAGMLNTGVLKGFVSIFNSAEACRTCNNTYPENGKPQDIKVQANTLLKKCTSKLQSA